MALGYVWTLEKQVAPLWADVEDRAECLLGRRELEQQAGSHQLAPLQKHFLGSVVLTPVVNAFGRVKAYEVIDGQQRTTTLPPLTQDAGMYGRKFLLGTELYIQVRPFRSSRIVSCCID